MSTFYLGQSLPYDALLECIQKVKPSCLVTSWLTAVDAKFVKNYFQKLAQETNQIRVFAGGYQIRINKATISDSVQHIESVDSIRRIAEI